MDRIAAATVGVVTVNGNRGFEDENLPDGIVGTDIPSSWLNPMQEEVQGVQALAGLVPDPNNWGQMAVAIRTLLAAMCWKSAPAGGGPIAVPAWATAMDFEGVGAGGGGASGNGTVAGGGGGAGGWMAGTIPVTGGSTVPYAIGAGGAASPSPNSIQVVVGGTGGSTTIGAGADTCTANGGQGGSAGNGTSPNFGGGIGGTVIASPFLVEIRQGGDGTDGNINDIFAGNGGVSVLGGGGRGGQGAGEPGRAPGSGGGGAYGPGGVAGIGAPGALRYRFRP